MNKNLKWDEKLAREVHQSYYSKTAKLKKIPKGIAAGLLVSAVLPGGGEKETDGEKGKHEIGGERVPIRFVSTHTIDSNIFAQSFRDKIAQKEIEPTQAKERLLKENIPEDFIDSNTGSMPSEHTEKVIAQAKEEGRLVLVRTGAAEKLKFWGKIFAYINNELRRVKIFDLRDLKNERAVIINYQMLLDNPGIALAVKNINRQLGKKKGLKLILALDDTKREGEFYEAVYKATDGLADLSGQFDKVVSAKERPKEIIRKIKMEFPEVEKIEVIGPQVWVVPYRMEECIIVICEIGGKNKTSQGDLALLVGLDALVSKGVLTPEEEKALSRRGVNKKGDFFAIESKEIGKEMQYIEKYQEEMKKYE